MDELTVINKSSAPAVEKGVARGREGVTTEQ